MSNREWRILGGKYGVATCWGPMENLKWQILNFDLRNKLVKRAKKGVVQKGSQTDIKQSDWRSHAPIRLREYENLFQWIP